MTPRILIAHSLGWPNVARLSISFRRAGFTVFAFAPKAHPVHAMLSPERTFVRSPGEPQASLRQAIEACEPQLIVPCDDRIAGDLHALHAASSGAQHRPVPGEISRLIERSLGSPKSFPLLASKRLLGTLSGLPGVHIPKTDPIESLKELRGWALRHGTPALLKLDGYVADARSLAPAYWKMQLRRSRLLRLRRSLLSGEIPSVRELSRPAAGVSVQSFVRGRLANCAVACWRGEVVASVAAEVVRGQSKFGVATVVRLVDGAAMVAAARSIAHRLQLSGMYGFDFVLDEKDGLPKLIEINPRATQTNHLSHRGVALPSALRKALDGARAAGEAEARYGDEIALFPQEWRRDPQSPFLTSAFHDVPYEEPELLRFYGYESARSAPLSHRAFARGGAG
jgi:hypothetical protein